MLASTLFVAPFLARAGEDVVAPAGPPPIVVSGQVGTPLEVPTGLSGVAGIRSALPPGLRISDTGVVVGTPLSEGNTEALVGVQKLLISIQNSIGSAQARATSGVAVTSPLTASPNPVAPGANVTLAVGTLAGGLVSYHWEFGDGLSANSGSASVSHSYAAAGSYHATVTARNGSNSAVSETYVTVGETAARATMTPKVKAPSVKANPFDTMKVTAGQTGAPASFDLANHEYSIGFVFAKGKTSKTGSTPDLIAKVPLIYDDSTGTALSVMVPPFFKSSWSSGRADTFIITDGVMSTTPVARTSIGKFFKSASKVPGLMTLSWIRANQTILTSSRSTLASPGTAAAFFDPKIVTDNDTEAASLGALITSLQGLEKKQTKDKLLSSAAKQSDSFITSMLTVGSKVTDTAYATACKNLLTAIAAAKDDSDPALQAAETGFANALLHAAGTRSADGRGFSISDGLKFTLAVLTVTATGVAVVAVAAGGGIAAGATAIAATGTAAIYIGVTATAAVATAGATALIAGQISKNQQTTDAGNKLLNESRQIATDTATNYVKENLPGNIINFLGGKIKVIATGSTTIGDIINAITSVNDAKNDLTTVVPIILNSSGSLTGGVIPSGSSYFFKIVGPATDTITGSISGTDGFTTSASGTGTVTSSVIPAGAPGVVDTLTGTDTTTGFTATLGTFKF
jgi:hypothetical protein